MSASDPQLNASPATVAGALRQVTRETFEDELVFDPVTGMLQVRAAGSDVAADAVPATAMVREGFFGPAALVSDRELRDLLAMTQGSRVVVLVRAVLRDDGDVVRFMVGPDAAQSFASSPAVLVVDRGAGPITTRSASELAGATDARYLLAVTEAEGHLGLRAYHREDTWELMEVQLVPDAAQVFSRNQGILECAALAKKRVAIVGLGSGGSTIAAELAKAGVGEFVLVDHDRLEIHNVGRHLCDLADLGRRKTLAVRDRILGRNPGAKVQLIDGDVVEEAARFRDLAETCDVLIGATDNNRSRRVVNRLALELGRPAIFGRAFRRACGGDVIRVRPGEGPCYECLITGRPSDEEVTHAGSAHAPAYSDVPVRVEPGLALDVAPIALMCARLAIQELVRGTGSGLEACEPDLQGALFLWVNRREHQFAQWKPMGFGVSGQTPFRWYAARAAQHPRCPVCREDDFLNELSRDLGPERTAGEA